jgi:hypothetical protein
MPRGQHDHDFDERLEMEIIVDANGPEEQALGWYYYLEEHLHFPFRARCVAERPTSPLAVGDVVDIRGMPVEEVCAGDVREHRLAETIARCPSVSIGGSRC